MILCKGSFFKLLFSIVVPSEPVEVIEKFLIIIKPQNWIINCSKPIKSI